MKTRPDLNDLSKQIVEANKKKGFHDKEQSNEHYLCLVISELMEAVEANRKDKKADIELMNKDIEEEKSYRNFLLNSKARLHPDTIEQLGKNSTDQAIFKAYFETYIKDSVADELADAIIRLLDLAGLRGWETEYEYNVHPDFFNNKSLTELIYHGVGVLFDRALYPDDSSRILIKYIETLAYSLNIDIWRHVELKLKYNATRERLHGKKY